jgi:hypothetical protein
LGKKKSFLPKSTIFLPELKSFLPKSDTDLPKSKVYLPKSKPDLPDKIIFLGKSAMDLPKSKAFPPELKPDLPDSETVQGLLKPEKAILNIKSGKLGTDWGVLFAGRGYAKLLLRYERPESRSRDLTGLLWKLNKSMHKTYG